MPGTSAVAYPTDLAIDVVLRDGATLHVRPVKPDDAAAVLSLFQRMSEQSLYYRFMEIPRLDLARAIAIATIDYDHEFVLVAEHGDLLAGIAGYYRDPNRPERAEVAFALAESSQGRGLGTRLLERLAEIARERRVRAFDAYVMGGNRRMLEVFQQSGFGVTHTVEEGVFHMTLDLDQTEAFAEAAAQRARVAAAASMRPFFEPRVVAVFGVSECGGMDSEILRNLKQTGYTGALVAVHSQLDRIGDCPAYRSVREIPLDVDLAVIVAPAPDVAPIVDDCIGKGVKALVVISAGFGESGEAGRALETALVEKIRAAGIRLVGPNCMGILNTDPAHRLNATFSPVYPSEGNIAFSTQSGALGLAILDYVTRLNLGISSFASIGNKADVSGNDLIQYWADDSRTKVILLYLESFGNPCKFADIARRVGRKKPIVVVKAGRSPAGARAASFHTGARATSDALVDTLLRQARVIRTQTLEEMFDVASVLSTQPLPAGRRVAIVTNAGGPGILAADACEANGLELPALTEDTQATLRALLPQAASVTNPVDMSASAAAEEYRIVIETVAADPNVDSVIAIFPPPLMTPAHEVAAAIKAGAATTSKTMLATFLGAPGTQPNLAPVPSLAFPESAAAALAHATRYGEWLRRPVPLAPAPRLSDRSLDRAQEIVLAALSAGRGWLSRTQCEDLLGAVGVNVAPVGTTPLTVQPILAGGVEMVVGGINDPAFGPMVVCGTGGIFVELFADVAFRMCPLSEAGAGELIQDVRGKVLLRGFRGTPALDEGALRRMLVAVSQLLDACPEIHEMNLNPVMVLASGAVAVDARITIGPKAAPARGRRIAY